MRPTIFSILLGVLGLAALGSSRGTLPIDPKAKAAIFVNKQLGFVFGLNVVENGDVYYHMNAPASHSWMGVGFGNSMTNTRMLISYRSADGSNLTNSCRMASGHSEPVLEADKVIERVVTDYYAPYENTLSPGGVLIAHAVCRNCSTWDGGYLDIGNTAQQFILALGPNTTLESDDPAAPLRFHQFHASFNLDMTVATNYTGDYGRVPAPQDPALQQPNSFSAFGNYFASDEYAATSDIDWAPKTHGILMCVAFLFIFPVGSVLLRLTRRVRFHAFAQMLGTAMVGGGVGAGIYVSRMYNKSKHFHAAHQLVGIAVCAVLITQLGLGFLNHAAYMRTGSPSLIGGIHRILGLFTVIFGLVNAGIGFDFAGNPRDDISYGTIAGIVGLILTSLTVWTIVFNRRRTYKPDKNATWEPTDYYQDSPDDYEMHEHPFAKAEDHSVRTPRTAHFVGE